MIEHIKANSAEGKKKHHHQNPVDENIKYISLEEPVFIHINSKVTDLFLKAIIENRF